MTEPKNILTIIKANYLQPAFLICAAVLALSGGAMSAMVKLSGRYLAKEPLPLKNPLSKLDGLALSPYRVAVKQEIDNADIIETLGTEDYIQWILEDASVPADSKVRFCSLFITYYGIPDKVPHVPEECYIGGGMRQAGSEAAVLTIRPGPRGSAEERQVSARYVIFAVTSSDLWGSETTFPIFYTFSVNGEYAGSRNDVRLIMNKNLFGKFSYFSKVEWKFYNNSFGRTVYPDRQEAIKASEKLMAALLPALEKEHWPGGLW